MQRWRQTTVVVVVEYTGTNEALVLQLRGHPDCRPEHIDMITNMMGKGIPTKGMVHLKVEGIEHLITRAPKKPPWAIEPPVSDSKWGADYEAVEEGYVMSEFTCEETSFEFNTAPDSNCCKCDTEHHRRKMLLHSGVTGRTFF